MPDNPAHPARAPRGPRPYSGGAYSGGALLPPGPEANGGGPGGAGEELVVSLRARPDTYRAAVETRLGAASSAADFRRKAQFVDYDGLRAACESWRADHPGRPYGHRRDLGLNPQPHSDDPTPRLLPLEGGYYGARKGSEPLHVQAGQHDGKVLVVNDTQFAVPDATVTARLYALGGRPLADAVTARLDLAERAITEVTTMPVARELPAAHLLRLTLTDATGRVRSVNDYLRCRTPMDLRSVNGLPFVRLEVRATRAQGPAVTATVRNTGTSPAAMVRLALLDEAGEELPAVADDNYLWLLPGEVRDVTLTLGEGPAESPAPSSAGRTGRTGRIRRSVAAQAYNAPRVCCGTDAVPVGCAAR